MFTKTKSSQETEVQQRNQSRFNFSRYGRLCDQENFHQSKPSSKSPEGYIPASPKKSPQNSSTYGFTAVARQKRGNFRFAVRTCKGQLSHHPNYFEGKARSPSWTFSKAQKYQNQKHEDYEVCQKNYMIKQKLSQQDLTKSSRQLFSDRVKINKSSSFISSGNETKQGSNGMGSTAGSQANYSILGIRQTSPVGFYKKTKISKPTYLRKEGIMKAEEQLEKDLQYQNQPCPKGYIQFYMKKARQPNRRVKNFEPYLESYNHQKQFDNFALTSYPTKPSHHIDMSLHLERSQFYKQRMGPNLEGYKIDLTRVNKSNVDLNLKKFRNTVRTRYDRVQPQPHTRLSYDCREKSLPGMVRLDKVIARNPELWPVVDPIIKKPEDQVYKKELQKHIKVKQINQALRPRCNEPAAAIF